MNYKSQKKNPVALVTGASRRIGNAIACLLHEEGFNIAIHYNHSKSEAEKLAQKLNDNRAESASIFCGDLEREETPKELIRQVVSWSGDLTVLVNNASVFWKSTLDACNYDLLQKGYKVNVWAAMALSLQAKTYLAKTNGVIINITDIHAVKPLRHYSDYCQTKAALLMQTKSLAKELAPTIRVNAVAPGAIAWPEGSNTLNEETKQLVMKKTPLQRHGAPEFIAQAVLSLIKNPFVTGQVLNVDGGRSIE